MSGGVGGEACAWTRECVVGTVDMEGGRVAVVLVEDGDGCGGCGSGGGS
jgi:hypothetical protein